MSPLPLPGPRGLPLLGSVFPFLRHGILGAFTSLAERYGPCYRLPLPLGHTAVCLAHPDGVERVLRGNRENYPKGSVYDGARLLLGNGLVTAEGEEWQRHRDLAQPAFKNAQLARYLHTMGECTEEMLAEWRRLPPGQAFDLGAAMTRLTLAIVGRTLFGLDLSHQGSEAGQAFRDGLRGIGSRGPGPLQVPLWLPTPVNLRFRRALVTLDRLVYEVIQRFRAGEAEHGDDTLLGALMAARDPQTGAGLSDRQLRDEVITLYLAGHETTANLLTWTFYALGRAPEVARRLEAELDALGDATPSLEDMRGLSYAPMVLSEVLRLYPPAWTIARDVAGPDTACGYAIPGGAFVLLSPFITQRLEAFWPDTACSYAIPDRSFVLLSPFITQRLEAFWPDPLRFDPERFAPANAKGRHPFAWFPFSAGPRVCIGKRFSLYEAQLVLAMVMRAFRVRLETREVGFKAEGTLHPDRPLVVRLEPRG